MDRWLSVLSRSFRGHDVATVALARGGRNVSESCLGRLAEIAHSGPRFAMIIDPNLRCRRVLSYRLPAELPSPLDIIGWAVALRKRDDAGTAGSRPMWWQAYDERPPRHRVSYV